MKLSKYSLLIVMLMITHNAFAAILTSGFFSRGGHSGSFPVNQGFLNLAGLNFLPHQQQPQANDQLPFPTLNQQPYLQESQADSMNQASILTPLIDPSNQIINGQSQANPSVQQNQQSTQQLLVPLNYQAVAQQQTQQNQQQDNQQSGQNSYPNQQNTLQNNNEQECYAQTPQEFNKNAPKDRTVIKTKVVGKNTGVQFDEYDESLSELNKVIINSGVWVDAIQFQYQNGQKSNFHGGKGGIVCPWTVPKGQRIARVNLRAGDFIDSIQFITNKGNKSPKWGHDGGQPFTIQIPEGYNIVGLFGGKGQFLDRIGFYIAPVDDYSPK